MEKRIYSAWAFTENESEKASMNREIYQDLKNKSKNFSYNGNPTKEDLDNYMCFKRIGNGYGYTKYAILSNPKKLSEIELALICDSGNLCYGYRREGNVMVIYID